MVEQPTPDTRNVMRVTTATAVRDRRMNATYVQLCDHDTEALCNVECADMAEAVALERGLRSLMERSEIWVATREQEDAQ